MQYYEYKIHNNESITRWRLDEMKRTPFSSPCTTFDAEVNMGEGYVQIVYPVRQAFLESHDISKAELYEGPYEHMYFPFENTRVDFSTFIHTPHVISINGETEIEISREDDYRFRVFTCGGMKLWVDGEEKLVFAPYTRNIPGDTYLTLHLTEGRHKLNVHADELAERDVFFYFEIRYLGEVPITGMVPCERPDVIRKKEEFLKSLYVEHGVFEKGDLRICYDPETLDEDAVVSISGSSDASVWKGVKSFTARKDASFGVIAPVDECPIGGYTFDFSVDADGYTLNRRTLFAIDSVSKTEKEAPATIEERRAEAKKFIYSHGADEISRAIIRMDLDKRMDETTEKFIRTSLKTIIDKADCADFRAVPLLLSLIRQREYYSDEFYEEIKNVFLGFRYWIDEPGNDVMWYFSENHAFLFHASQYLAGYLFPDDVFTVSGRTGREQMKIGHERLIHWYGNFNKYHYAEWNSATYFPVDFYGLLTLYEVSPDEDIRNLSKEALDYTFSVIENNSYRGIMAASYGRCYEKTLKARTQIETNFFSWIGYGVGRMSVNNKAASLMAYSSYVPPENDTIRVKDGEAITVKAVQGLNPVYTYLYRTNTFSVGSANRFKVFKHGHQQHVFDLSFGRKNRQFYVNHPGERAFSGENRPAYWAGNGTCPLVVQYKALVTMFFDIDPEELVHYIHTWSPFNDYDEVRIKGNYLFVRVDDSYMAAFFSNGFAMTDRGANKDKEVISQGLKHFVAVRAADKHECGSFDEFITNVMSSEIVYDLDAHKATVNDFRYGKLYVDESVTKLNDEVLPDTWGDEITKETY